MKQFLTFFSLCILFSASRCKSDSLCVVDYTFNPKAFLTHKDTFRIGDTIWLDMRVPNKELLDERSGKMINIGNWNMSLDLNMYKLDTTDFWVGVNGILFFSTVDKIGKMLSIPIGRSISNPLYFNDVGIDKVLKIGFIPQKKGIYSISFSFGTGSHNELENPNFGISDCIDKPFVHINTNDGDCNYYLQQKRQYLTAEAESVYVYNGAYAFVVIP